MEHQKCAGGTDCCRSSGKSNRSVKTWTSGWKRYTTKSERHIHSRWSGDVIRRTGMKKFNAVSHNRALFSNSTCQRRGLSSSGLLECSFSKRKCGRHGMICWVLAMEMLQGVWKQHLRPRAVVEYGVKSFLPSPPNYVTRSPGLNYVTIKVRKVRPLVMSHDSLP